MCHIKLTRCGVDFGVWFSLGLFYCCNYIKGLTIEGLATPSGQIKFNQFLTCINAEFVVHCNCKWPVWINVEKCACITYYYIIRVFYIVSQHDINSNSKFNSNSMHFGSMKMILFMDGTYVEDVVR